MSTDGASEIPTGENVGPNYSSIIMAQLMQTGVVAQNHFVTMTKAQDFDYLENKRLIDLQESVGLREISRNPETES